MNEMYNIIKNVINGKAYELTTMLTKIKTLWIENDITDEQKEELVELARENANVQNSIDVMAKLEELEQRVRELEQSKSSDSESTEEEVVVYPEFVVGKWYYNGDKITYNGKNYVCVAPTGQVCTWNPDDYPTYWEETE